VNGLRPGLSGAPLGYERERIKARVREVGAFSYVCAVENGYNVELTDK